MTGESSFQTLKLWPPHFGQGGQTLESGAAGVIKSEFPIWVLPAPNGTFSNSVSAAGQQVFFQAFFPLVIALSVLPEPLESVRGWRSRGVKV
jgi:hypothetical protein